MQKKVLQLQRQSCNVSCRFSLFWHFYKFGFISRFLFVLQDRAKTYCICESVTPRNLPIMLTLLHSLRVIKCVIVSFVPSVQILVHTIKVLPTLSKVEAVKLFKLIWWKKTIKYSSVGQFSYSTCEWQF